MASLHCPKCRGRLLDAIEENGVEIDTCARCGGLWFDGGELRRTIGPGRASMPARGRDLERRGTVTGFRCPRCRSTPEYFSQSHRDQALVEVKVGGDQGVLVDTCAHCHGVWLDHGELDGLRSVKAAAGGEREYAAERTWGHWLFQLATALPVEFNFKPRRIPVVTWVLIALNVLAYVVQWSSSDVEALVERYGLVPARSGEEVWWISLVTHNFLHGNIFHLLGNLYFLWILGDNIEDVFGRFKFLGFYALAALCSAFADNLSMVSPEIPRIGASGAVSGLLGAYAILFRRAQLTFMLVVFQFKLNASSYILLWLAFNLIGLLLGVEGIAWEGHLGGFACGLVVALLSYRALLRRDPLLRLLNGVRTPVGGAVGSP